MLTIEQLPVELLAVVAEFAVHCVPRATMLLRATRDPVRVGAALGRAASLWSAPGPCAAIFGDHITWETCESGACEEDRAYTAGLLRMLRTRVEEEEEEEELDETHAVVTALTPRVAEDLAQVRHLSITRALDAGAVSLLPRFVALRALSIRGASSVSGRMPLRALRGATHLTALALCDFALSAEDIAALSCGSSTLANLHLHSCSTTLGSPATLGAGLRHLATLKRLRATATVLGDADICAMFCAGDSARYPPLTLESLIVEVSRIGPRGLRLLASAAAAAATQSRPFEVELPIDPLSCSTNDYAALGPSLRRVDMMRGWELTDADATRLCASMPWLNHLSLALHTPRAFAVMPSLQRMRALQTLELRLGFFDSALPCALSALKNLRVLKIAMVSCNINHTATDLRVVCQLPELEELRIAVPESSHKPLAAVIEPTCWDLVRVHGKLRRFESSGAAVGDTDLGAISSVASLTHLRANCCTHVTDAGLTHLVRLPELAVLLLHSPMPLVTAAGVAVIALMPAVARLALAAPPSLHIDRFFALLRSCRALAEFDILEVSGRLDASFVAGLASLRLLRRVRLPPWVAVGQELRESIERFVPITTAP